MTHKPVHFPQGLCLAAILATGLGLTASAAGAQWGAAPKEPDALQMAWPYVNVAWMWTWLLVWPAIALDKSPADRSQLLFDFLILIVAAIPAIGIAAFLSGTPMSRLLRTLAVQLATGLFTGGVIGWRRRLPCALLAGFLATLAVVMPVAEYLWIEFFPTAPQIWTHWMPLNAIAGKEIPYGISGVYALLGVALFLSAPRNHPPLKPAE
jgi:hypothetical protein